MATENPAPVTAVEQDEHAALFEESEEMQKNARLEISDEDWVELSAGDAEGAKDVKGSSSMVDSVFKDVSALQPSFWSLGFDFAEKNWLSISIGTASSFAVSLVPREYPPEAIPEPKSLSILQRLVLAVLRRAKSVAHSLHTEHFELARLRLSLAGIGLAIPSVTGTIYMRERAPEAPGSGAQAKGEQGQGQEGEQGRPGFFGRAKAAVGSLFHSGDKGKGDDTASSSAADAATTTATTTAAASASAASPPPPPPGSVLSNERRPESELREGVEDLLDGRAENVRAAADRDDVAAPLGSGNTTQGSNAAVDRVVELSRNRAQEIAANLNSGAPAPDATAEETADKKGVEAMLAHVASAGGEVVNSGKTFFGGKSRSVLQRIVADMRDLRTALAACGFALETKAEHKAWLAVIVGTFVGIQISVTPTTNRPEIDISKTFPHLTLLQRTVLRTLRSCDKIAVNLAMRKLRVKQMDFKLSGLGLAIPVASVTFTLTDMTAEEKQQYELLRLSSSSAFSADAAAAGALGGKDAATEALIDEKLDEKHDVAMGEEEKPEDSSEASAPAAAGAAAAGPAASGAAAAGAAASSAAASSGEPGKESTEDKASESEKGGKSKSAFGFILEGLQGGAQAAKNLVCNASAASMRAIHATGSGAQSVLQAATGSVSSLYHKLIPRREQSDSVDTVLSHAEATSGHLRGLALELNRPSWLSLTLGTSNGFSVSFRPVSTAPDTLTLPAAIEPETASDRTSGRHLITKLMNSLSRSQTFASHLRRRVLTINSYDLNAGGVGLDIPSLSASVNLDRDPSMSL